MTSMVLDEAADALETLLADQRDTAGIFIAKANEWKAFIGGLSGTTYSRRHLEDLRDKARTASGKSDMQAKLEILQAIRGDPMLGVMLIIATIPAVARRQNPFWWGLQFAEQISSTRIALGGPVADPANYTGPIWTIKQLPAPSSSRKYLIFSDIHRDSEPDYKPPFEGGATDHFRANSKLYLHCLKYAEANGYTVIEGGDCEELWFIGDAYPTDNNNKLDPKAKLEECFRDYQNIFDKLAALHAAGRYFRIQGNHDSFIKEPALKTALKNRMAPGDPASFEVYDACVIPGVKTMTDHGFLSKLPILADAAATAATKGQAETEIVADLAKGWLGMDSNDYQTRCNFLICHGHQFDFWNNPDNELLGMMIANTLGVTADKLMDPLLDARGIALQGNPFIDFQDILASLIGFNSFPARQPSIRFAHDVQHRANSQRLVLDDIMFSETIPTLWGGLMLALNETKADGTVKTPAASRAELNLANPVDLWTYLNRHSFNHVCLGHTHNPQSQPFITLKNLAGLVPIAGGALGKLAGLLPFNEFARLKTGYFNSGTAGWMEGVIWAIEIDATGQARLVYWVDDLPGITVAQGEPLIRPQYMDWELTPLKSTDKTKINQAVSQALGTAYQTASQPVKAVRDAIIDMVEKAQGDIADLDRMFQDFMVLPTQFLGGALMHGHDLLDNLQKLDRVYRLLEIEPWETLGLGDASDAIRQQIDGKLQIMRDFSADVLMSVKRRSLQGFLPGTKETISIKMPVPRGVDTAIKAFSTAILPIIESELKAFDPARSARDALRTANQAADHAAALIYSIVGDFPRSMPFFSQMSDALDPTARARASEHPIMNAMFSTLWMYPYAGTHVDIGDKVRITSSFVLVPELATLTVTLSKPQDANRPTRYNAPLVS